MTHSILNDIMLLRTNTLVDWFEYFKKINCSIFDQILKTGAENNNNAEAKAKNTILFILCAFDEESPMVISRQDAIEEKIQICEYLDIPEYQRQDLMYLQDEVLRKCVTSYLMQFAGEIFRNYMFMKIQLLDFELMITNKDFMYDKQEDEEGKSISCHFDSKENMKAIQQKEILSRLIVKTENEMRAKIRLRGIDMLKEWKHKTESAGSKRKSSKGHPESLVADKN